MIEQAPREKFFKALNALKMNELDRCEVLCRELLGLNAKEVNSLRLLGQVKHRQGELEAAERYFRQVIDIAKDYPQAHADLGRIQFENQQFAQAEKSLKRAIEIDPGLKSARNLLERVLAEIGKLDEQAHHAEINQRRRALKAELANAVALMKQDKAEEAEKICLSVLKTDPNSVGAKELLINRAMDTNRASWAEQLSRSLVQQMPENQ